MAMPSPGRLAAIAARARKRNRQLDQEKTDEERRAERLALVRKRRRDRRESEMRERRARFRTVWTGLCATLATGLFLFVVIAGAGMAPRSLFFVTAGKGIDEEERRLLANLARPGTPGLTRKHPKWMSRFELDGARFGMTPQMLTWLRPEAETSADGTKVDFRHDGGLYRVLFWGPEERRRAWRIQFERSYAGRDLAAVRTHLESQIGTSFSQECRQSGLEKARICDMMWMPAEGILVQARLELPDAPSRGLNVDVTATDTIARRDLMKPGALELLQAKTVLVERRARSTMRDGALPFDVTRSNIERATEDLYDELAAKRGSLR